MDINLNNLSGKPLFDGLFSAIVPCYNEEEMISIFYDEFLKAIADMNNPDFELIFVDDGSSDSTLEKLRALAEKDNRVHYISFSRNFGKEAAMYAGLKEARGDYIAIMDADLQDPPSLLKEMFKDLINCGFDSVATRRKTREGEPPIRSFGARLFYSIFNACSKLQFKEGARDFRLMKRKVLDAVLQLGEYNRFIKGFYEWVGFKTKWIEFDNVERKAGQTKWDIYQLLAYSIDAFSSFTTVPLKFVSILGGSFCVLSIFAIFFLFVRKILFTNCAVNGWTSMMCVMFFLSGVQLCCLGILGHYASKIYLETKKRPQYILKEKK